METKKHFSLCCHTVVLLMKARKKKMNGRVGLRSSHGNSRIMHMFVILLQQLLLIQQVLVSHARLTANNEALRPSDEHLINKFDQDVNLSVDIPALQDTLELVRLSNFVYVLKLKGATDCSNFPSIYEEYVQDEAASYYAPSTNDFPALTNYTFKCHMYERDKQDTQVLIVSRQSTSTNNNDDGSSSEEDYIAVVFAGTDDFRNALTDTDILTKHFGPDDYNDDQTNNERIYNFPPRSENIRVHAGFNNAVFKRGLFDRVFKHIKAYKEDNPSARIFTTGHSLGASDAVLTSVALKLQDEFVDKDIHSINFGCPKTGTRKWKDFVNKLDGLGIWRLVNGIDLVPRLPGVRFHHVGHTVQLDSDAARGYWLHQGDKSLGYAGIPYGWNSKYMCE